MNGELQGYLLDSCFVLRYFAQDAQTLAFLADRHILPSQCYISVITRLEVLGFAGLSEQDETNLREILALFNTLPLSEPVEICTIEVRRRHQIKLPDAIILATAMTHELKLLSHDKRLLKQVSK